jgi:hypothetical protein
MKKFEDLSSSSLTFVGYFIDRSDIIEKNTVPFLEFWDIERIAKAGRLHELFNKVMFCVDGYDADARPIFAIPEVRSFLQELTHEWPYFFYAASLEDTFLIRLIQCMIPNLTAVMADDTPRRYIAKMNVSDANRAYNVLLKGLCRACGLDSHMNQEKFDARVAAIQKCLTSERLNGQRQ